MVPEVSSAATKAEKRSVTALLSILLSIICWDYLLFLTRLEAFLFWLIRAQNIKKKNWKVEAKCKRRTISNEEIKLFLHRETKISQVSKVASSPGCYNVLKPRTRTVLCTEKPIRFSELGGLTRGLVLHSCAPLALGSCGARS